MNYLNYSMIRQIVCWPTFKWISWIQIPNTKYMICDLCTLSLGFLFCIINLDAWYVSVWSVDRNICFFISNQFPYAAHICLFGFRIEKQCEFRFIFFSCVKNCNSVSLSLVSVHSFHHLKPIFITIINWMVVSYNFFSLIFSVRISQNDMIRIGRCPWPSNFEQKKWIRLF